MPLLTTQSAKSFGLNNFISLSNNNFFSIQTATVDASGASSITFSSIPQTYTHLQIRGFARTNAATALLMTFNGTSSTYRNTYLEGNGGGSATSGGLETTLSGIGLYGGLPYNSLGSYWWGFSVIDIIDYTNTNKNKIVRALNGYDLDSTNPYGYVDVDGGYWANTNAISSITIGLQAGTLFAQNTQFALYGIR